MNNSGKPFKYIHSSAPLRINDIGGWTDTWFSGEGNVLNLAVYPRIKVQIKVMDNIKRIQERVMIFADNYGESFTVNPEDPRYDHHPILQGAVNSLPIPKEFLLEIHIHSDIPGGISMGTSASVCVALLGGLSRLDSRKRSRDEIVRIAHCVETEKLKLQSGIQDQICAAYGGICFIHMYQYPKARVKNVSLTKGLWQELNSRLILVYLGGSHNSSAIHKNVIAELERGGPQSRIIHDMKNLAAEAKAHLTGNNLERYGEVMIRNNEYQRSLHPMLIPKEADRVIEIAKEYQASGWKVNGAGGQGGSVTILGNRDEKSRMAMIKKIDGSESEVRSIPISLSSKGLTMRISRSFC